MTGVGLLGGAAVIGLVSLFVAWGQISFFGISAEYGKPMDCYTDSSACFSGDSVMAGIGAVALAIGVVLLIIAAIVGMQGPRKGLELAFTADLVATIAVIVYAIGLNNLSHTFPTYIGFWLGLVMVILAFLAPILMKGARAPMPVMGMPMGGRPTTMRTTAQTTTVTTSKTTTTAAGGMRRLKCPKCQSVIMVAAGVKPSCANCGFGR